jgi:hypothetical protein
MFSTSVWTSFNDLLHTYNWFLESVLSPNSSLSFFRTSAGFSFLLFRNIRIMGCPTVEGTTFSLTVITTNKKQADTEQYVTTVLDILPLTIRKMILFYTETSTLEKSSPVYI